MKQQQLLILATTALRDLSQGWAASEISAGDEQGLDRLLVMLTTHLRGRGINDEGGLDCEATRHIVVASPKSTEATLREDLAELKELGLTFGDCVDIFGETEASSPFVRAAIENAREGEIEVDVPAVVSKGADDGDPHAGGNLMTTQNNTAAVPKATVHMQVHSASGCESTTRTLALRVDENFITRLRELSKLCKEHCLSEAREEHYPDWESDDEYPITTSDLVVTSHSFWFVGYPQDTEGHIETGARDIEGFLADVAKGVTRFD